MDECNVAQELERLEHLLTNCFEEWKLDNDAAAYRSFIGFLDVLEHMAACHCDRLNDVKEPLYAALEELDLLVRNKDIVSICDVMEYQLLPIVRIQKRDGASK